MARSRTRSVGPVACSAIALLLTGCPKKPPPGPEPKASASAAVAAPSASVPPSAPASYVRDPSPGVARWEDVDKEKDCQVRARDLESNLAFGGLGMAARGKEFAFAWLLTTGTKGEGLVAFTGYDSLTRTLGASHGLGKAQPVAPRVFPSTGDSWTVAFFDTEGLVFTRATWAPSLADLSRVGAVTYDRRDDTSIAPSAKGSLLAAAPFGAAPNAQVGLFEFASLDADAPAVRTIGATRGAHAPRHPAVAEDGDGYVVAWEDQDPASKRSVIATARFSATGKELGQQKIVSNPAMNAERPTVANTTHGAQVAWIESEGEGRPTTVFTRQLDDHGGVAGPAYRVEDAYAPRLVALSTGSALMMLRKPGGTLQVLLVGLDDQAKPSARGFVAAASAEKKPLSDEVPAIAIAADGRLGLSWTDTAERRAHFKTLVATCLGTGAGAPATGASARPATSAEPAPSAP